MGVSDYTTAEIDNDSHKARIIFTSSTSQRYVARSRDRPADIFQEISEDRIQSVIVVVKLLPNFENSRLLVALDFTNF